jgi:hypothetical protein
MHKLPTPALDRLLRLADAAGLTHLAALAWAELINRGVMPTT